MKTKRVVRRLVPVLILCAAATAARAQGERAVPTKVMVRAVSRDAKVIGTKVGGARITIRDDATSEVLAQGIQEGETGNTDQIMVRPRQRGAPLFDAPATAGFLATLMLKRPTVVQVTAEGPLAAPQSIRRVSKTLLLVPGQDVLGDGIVLEIHGFIVTLVAPISDARHAVGEALEVRAVVTLTCGCPTEPGGLWDADKIKVVARLLRDGRVEDEVPLKYAGASSTFTGRVTFKSPGPYELEVLAMDAANANFGSVRRGVTMMR